MAIDNIGSTAVSSSNCSRSHPHLVRQRNMPVFAVIVLGDLDMAAFQHHPGRRLLQHRAAFLHHAYRRLLFFSSRSSHVSSESSSRRSELPRRCEPFEQASPHSPVSENAPINEGEIENRAKVTLAQRQSISGRRNGPGTNWRPEPYHTRVVTPHIAAHRHSRSLSLVH